MDSLFGIGMSELVVILIIAGIVMGPERIAHVARWLGKTTVQLQAISRGFVRQLTNELDGSHDGQAIREAMNEVQSLRAELQNLRQELTTATAPVLKESQQLLQETENSIHPPDLAAGPKNGATAVPVPPPLELPRLTAVADDPE